MKRSGFKKTLKPKKCEICTGKFTPRNSLQTVCRPICAINKLSADKKKQAKKDLREGREKLKTKSDYLREAQTVVNKYRRLIDSGKPCCSCDKPDDGTHQRHASHYRSVGACSALRFNLKNIHTSCQQCNTTKSGNLLEYRLRLVKRFGTEYVEWLESNNQAIRYDIDYLKRLKKIFSKKIRRYKVNNV